MRDRQSLIHHPLLTGSFAIWAAVFILYSVAFGHNFFFDEENIILRNPLIRDLSLIPELFRNGYFYFEARPAIDWTQYFRPLTSVTFSIDYALWKTNPLGYNLTNTVLHAGVCTLLYLFLFRILRNGLAAFLAAILYSVHTLNTEAVTYIASRGDVLGGLLMLSALLLYWDRRLAAACFFFFTALFAKEGAVLFPAYLLLLEICFPDGGWRTAAKRVFPFFALIFIYLLYRKVWCPVPLGPPENDLRTAALRVLSMGPAFLDYLRALVLPEPFKFCQTVKFAAGFKSPLVWQTLAVVMVLAAAWLSALRRRGAAFFGLSFFLVSLAPYLQAVHFYPEWAEHYLYIGAMGLAVLVGCLAREVMARGRRGPMAVLLAVYVLFFVFLCVRTWQRNAVYNDAKKYYRTLAASDSPYAFYGYQNLARLAMEEGRWADVPVPLKAALAMEENSDVTHNLLGAYYLREKNVEKAVAHFRRAFELSPEDYRYLLNAGISLAQAEAYEEALELFLEIHERAPAMLSVYTNLMSVYEMAGHPEKSLEWARKGLAAFENHPKERAVLWMALGRSSFRQGDLGASREAFESLFREYPDTFWYGDVARLMTGRLTAEAFGQIVETRYPGFDEPAQVLIMMSLVLRNDPEGVKSRLISSREALHRQADRQPLIEREIEVAEKFAGLGDERR